MIQQNTHCTVETIGTVKDVRRTYINDQPVAAVTIQYMICGKDYQFTENIDCPLEAIEIGHPIKIAYNPHAPAQAHIIGNRT